MSISQLYKEIHANYMQHSCQLCMMLASYTQEHIRCTAKYP